MTGIFTRPRALSVLPRGTQTTAVSVLVAAISLATISPARAADQPDFSVVKKVQRNQVAFREEASTLPDGTNYLIRVPEKWNGILIRDLDYAQRVSQAARMARYDRLLEHGYALAGTARHPLRAWQYDPAREISNLDLVLDKFEASFKKPEYVIQFGCSGGGHVSLAVAEDFHERIDGSVVMSGHTPVWLMNTFLDGWFALQTLLGEYYEDADYGPASDLIIIGLANDGTANATGHGVEGKVPKAWRHAFDAANASEKGRARMALAFAVAQWPIWMADGIPLPEYSDLKAVQNSIFQSLQRLSGSPGGEARILFENAAQGQQLSWNDSVDYQAYFDNANASLRSSVEQLYADAGLNLKSDIQRLNSAPGVLASQHALDYWGAKGRTVVGKPAIPVFRLHGLGDYQIPYTLMLGYEQAVKKNQAGDLLRTALIKSTGHCTESAISTAESSAAIEVMMQRLKNGSWPKTDATALNQLARSLDDSSARFIEPANYSIDIYNRLWVPSSHKED